MNVYAIINVALALILAPLLLGIINRVKAIFAGRCGVPLLQVYFDLWRLFHKDFVYSRTTSWITQSVPIVLMAATLTVLFLLPMMGNPGLLSFSGDFVVIIYLMALMRFFIVIGAMDSGSAFEGMGAAREVFFAALAEPALMMIFVTLIFVTKSVSLAGLAMPHQTWALYSPQLLMLSVAFFIILLLECSRIPFDDPNTHLELTMIHEVMILDNAGFDLGLILYSASIKLWIFASLIVSFFLPGLIAFVFGSRALGFWQGLVLHLVGICLVAVAVGMVESSMARFKITRASRLILGSFLIAVIAILLL